MWNWILLAISIAITAWIIASIFIPSSVAPGKESRLKKNLQMLLSARSGYAALSLVGLAALWWLYKSNLTVAGVAEWVWANLLFTLVATTVVMIVAYNLFPKVWLLPAIIVLALLAAHWANTPSSSSSGKSQQVLLLAPGEKSRIPVPPGRRVVVKGDDFALSCLYRNGHEITVIPGKESCPDGDMPFVRVTNLRSTKKNALTYSYER